MKNLQNKKKIIYIILAVILIVLGSYMKQFEGGEHSAQVSSSESVVDYVEYYFRNDNLLKQHYEKHGVEMGFDSMEEYEEAACAVIYNPNVLTKTEKEDGDYVYYVEESNEFVILSPDGYIRTYFNPSAGIDYYNRQ
jgi:pyocin large subunit-like protein